MTDKIKEMIALCEKNLKPIPGMTGYYACEDGFIYSTNHRYGKGVRKLFAAKDNKGYWKTEVMRQDGYKKTLVHRMVCMAFHGLPKEGQITRHLNGIRDDNRPSNLAWGTYKENSQDKVLHGTCKAAENGRLWAQRKRGTGIGGYYNKKTKAWYGRISFNHKKIYLGKFKTQEEMKTAYHKAAKDLNQLLEGKDENKNS